MAIFDEDVDVIADKDGWKQKMVIHALREMIDFRSKFMKKFKIGYQFSSSTWSRAKQKQLRDVLYDAMSDTTIPSTKVNAIDLYDKIRKDVRSKSYTDYEIRRVAVQETNKMKIAFQLQMYKAAGIKKVKRNEKIDDRTSEECKKANGKIYDIDALLDGREKMLPAHIFCRGYYSPVME